MKGDSIFISAIKTEKKGSVVNETLKRLKEKYRVTKFGRKKPTGLMRRNDLLFFLNSGFVSPCSSSSSSFFVVVAVDVWLRVKRKTENVS